MHALRVIERHFSVAVGLESALWLAFEDERVEASRIHVRLLGHLAIVDVVVKKALLAVDHGTQVSRLANLFYQPLQDWNDVLVVETLDLVREDLGRALHHLQCLHYLLAELDLLTQVQVVLKVKLHLVVASGDAPAHASEDLVEGLYVQTRSEVASTHQTVTDLLKQLRCFIVLYSTQHF